MLPAVDMSPAVLCCFVFVLCVNFPACGGWGVPLLLLVFCQITSLSGVISLISQGCGVPIE